MRDASVRSRVLTGTRALFLATVVVALVAGYVGMQRYVASLPEGQFASGFWNIAYYDLQLFVLGAKPLEEPGPYPFLLDLARFAAPAVTVYALIEAGRAVFAGQFRRWWVRRRRGNTIVVGETTAARVLVANLRAEGGRRQRRRIVAVHYGDSRTLREAGIARAHVLYAFDDDHHDSTLNVATALAAAKGTRASPRRPRLRVYAHVSNATLALALRARRLGMADSDRLDVDFVNVDEMAARGLLSAGDVTIDASRAPHILVAGLGTFGQALLVEYARYWRLHSSRRAQRVGVTLVDPDASAIVAELSARWGILSDVFDLTLIDGTLDTALTAGTGASFHRVFLCYDDEERALSTALTAASLWQGGPDSVVVRLNRLSRHGEVFHTSGHNILDDLGHRLRLVDQTKIACDPAVIAKDLVERLAEAIHEHYLLQRLGEGTQLNDPTKRAMRRWSDLDEDLREANRAQAGDIGAKLSMIDATVAPRAPGVAPFSFTDDEVKRLAIREHDRWRAEREAKGIRRLPALVAWDRLPEAEREKDREAVRNLPDILADVGLQIVRLSAALP